MRRLGNDVADDHASGDGKPCLPLIVGHVEARNIVSKSGISGQPYAINPYVGCQHACKYCYAQFMSRFSGHVEPWGRYVDVKDWKPIANPHRYDGSTMFLSSVTDPYQPIEATEMRTRAALEQLVGTTARINVTTKSDLVLRDLDLLRRFDDVTVAFSLNTLDDAFRADMDDAVSVARRLDAMCVVHDTGIRCVCFVAPTFLGITDIGALVDAVRDRCDEVWIDSLNMRDAYKARIIGYVEDRHPTLLPLYRRIYDEGDWGYWDGMLEDVKRIADARGMRCECGDDPTDETSESSRPDDCGDGDEVCKVIRCFFAKEWKERSEDDSLVEQRKATVESQLLAANLFEE